VLKKNGRTWAYWTVQLVIVALLAACTGQGTKAALYLVPLDLRLQAAYGESCVSVGLQNGDTLNVAVVAASADGLARDQAADEDRSIASFVCENYPSMAEIDRVRVTLEAHQDRFLFGSTRSATYTLEHTVLECDSNREAAAAIELYFDSLAGDARALRSVPEVQGLMRSRPGGRSRLARYVRENGAAQTVVQLACASPSDRAFWKGRQGDDVSCELTLGKLDNT